MEPAAATAADSAAAATCWSATADVPPLPISNSSCRVIVLGSTPSLLIIRFSSTPRSLQRHPPRQGMSPSYAPESGAHVRRYNTAPPTGSNQRSTQAPIKHAAHWCHLACSDVQQQARKHCMSTYSQIWNLAARYQAENKGIAWTYHWWARSQAASRAL